MDTRNRHRGGQHGSHHHLFHEFHLEDPSSIVSVAETDSPQVRLAAAATRCVISGRTHRPRARRIATHYVRVCFASGGVQYSGCEKSLWSAVACHRFLLPQTISSQKTASWQWTRKETQSGDKSPHSKRGFLHNLTAWPRRPNVLVENHVPRQISNDMCKQADLCYNHRSYVPHTVKALERVSGNQELDRATGPCTVSS